MMKVMCGIEALVPASLQDANCGVMVVPRIEILGCLRVMPSASCFGVDGFLRREASVTFKR